MDNIQLTLQTMDGIERMGNGKPWLKPREGDHDRVLELKRLYSNSEEGYTKVALERFLGWLSDTDQMVCSLIELSEDYMANPDQYKSLLEAAIQDMKETFHDEGYWDA